MSTMELARGCFCWQQGQQNEGWQLRVDVTMVKVVPEISSANSKPSHAICTLRQTKHFTRGLTFLCRWLQRQYTAFPRYLMFPCSSSPPLRMEAAGTYEALAPTYQSHIPEDCILHIKRRENLNSHICRYKSHRTKFLWLPGRQL